MTRLQKEEETRKWQQIASQYYAAKYYAELEKVSTENK
jgi:hypothetical protein